MHSWILFFCWLNFNMWMTSVGCICDGHLPLLGPDHSSYPWCHSPRGRGRDLLLSGARVGKTPDIQGLWHYSAVDIDQNLHDPSDIHDIKIISKTIVYLNVSRFGGMQQSRFSTRWEWRGEVWSPWPASTNSTTTVTVTLWLSPWLTVAPVCLPGWSSSLC